MTDEYEKAALAEYTVSSTALKNVKNTFASLTKSYTRYNNLIAKSIEASPIKPACKAGCAYCCYYKVEVKAHELLLIHDHMQKHFSAAVIEQILDEANSNASQIRQLTPEQHLATNIKCPFLRDNQCSIYDVRPFRCRNFHATDVGGCEQSYLDPASLNVPTSLIESVALFGDAHTQGFEAAAQHAGYDSRTYDLNTALLDVFNEPAAFKRFKQGKRSFPNAIEVVDV